MNKILLQLLLIGSLVSFVNTESTLACFAIVVGKKASANGSVLVGHNEQNSGIRYLNFRKIPEMNHKNGEVMKLMNGGTALMPPKTNGYLWTENPDCTFSDAYINDKGVAVVTDFCAGRGEKTEDLEKEGQLKDKGVAYLFRRMIAMKANTAREGVIIAGNIISHWGYGASRTLVIADPNEAWVLCATHGKQWVAERVPDDKVAIIPNVYTIGNIDFKDKENFMGSKNLVKYAIDKGWYNPKSGNPFNFSEVYSEPRENLIDPRAQVGQEVITGQKVDTSKNERLPFAVTPNKKLAVQDIIKILRTFKDINIYKGIDITDLGNPEIIKEMKEARQATGNICTPRTQEAAVFELNSKYPPSIGCIYWRATAEPSSSVLTPWYVGITDTPNEYHPTNEDINDILTVKHHFSTNEDNFKPDYEKAWWIYRKLQDEVNKDKAARTVLVRDYWNKFEAHIFKDQKDIQTKAFRIYQKDPAKAEEFLTNYCSEISLSALSDAKQLIKQLEQSDKTDKPNKQ
jgi:dipeptidase